METAAEFGRLAMFPLQIGIPARRGSAAADLRAPLCRVGAGLYARQQP